MDYRERFQVAARAALNEYERYMGKDDPTEPFLAALTKAAEDWAERREVVEYTGQLVGGPDDGNLITATTDKVPCEVIYRHWLDGPNAMVETIVSGEYVWDPERGAFRWSRS